MDTIYGDPWSNAHRKFNVPAYRGALGGMSLLLVNFRITKLNEFGLLSNIDRWYSSPKAASALALYRHGLDRHTVQGGRPTD